MVDVDRLEALVKELAEENVKLSNKLRDATDAQRADVDTVIAAMAQGGGGGNLQPQPIVQPNAAAVRAKNVANLKLAFRKSGKVKDFKENQEIKVQE